MLLLQSNSEMDFWDEKQLKKYRLKTSRLAKEHMFYIYLLEQNGMLKTN